MKLSSKIRKSLPEPYQLYLRIRGAPSNIRELVDIGRKLLIILEDIVKREELTRDLDEAYILALRFIEGIRLLRERYKEEFVPEHISKTLAEIETESKNVIATIEKMINVLRSARNELYDMKIMLDELRNVLKRMWKAIKLTEKIEKELIKVGSIKLKRFLTVSG